MGDITEVVCSKVPDKGDEDFGNDALSLSKYEANRVVVRIWLSKFNPSRAKCSLKVILQEPSAKDVTSSECTYVLTREDLFYFNGSNIIKVEIDGDKSSKLESIKTKLSIQVGQEIDGLTPQQLGMVASFSGHEHVGVGHVSIETPHKYASFWPDTYTWGIPKSARGEPTGCYEEDITPKCEGRAADHVFCFYSLDTNEMERKFEDIIRSNPRWAIARLGRKDVYSCASFAWELLAIGGIERLVPKLEQSRIASDGITGGSKMSSFDTKCGSIYSSEIIFGCLIKNPDFLAKYVEKAKKEELSKVTLTQTLEFHGETSIISSKRQSCLLYCFDTMRTWPKTTLATTGAVIFASAIAAYNKEQCTIL